MYLESFLIIANKTKTKGMWLMTFTLSCVCMCSDRDRERTRRSEGKGVEQGFQEPGQIVLLFIGFPKSGAGYSQPTKKFWQGTFRLHRAFLSAKLSESQELMLA